MHKSLIMKISTLCCYFIVMLLVSRGSYCIPLEQFLPFGASNGDSVLPSGSTAQANVSLPVPFVYYTQQYTKVYVSVNGLLSFETPISAYNPQMFPVDTSLIAPFLADADTEGTGTVWYNVNDDNSTTGQIVAEAVKEYFDDDDFISEVVLTVTWDNVGYHPMMIDMVNTFQCIMATDGISSYVIFNYLDNGINWYTANDRDGVPAQVGFNKGCSDSESGDNEGSGSVEMCGVYKVLDESSTVDIINVEEKSNIDGGNPGFYMWRVSGVNIIDGSPSSCNNEDVNTITINPRYGHQFGGTPIIITGPCYEETDDIQCVFNNDKLVNGIVIDEGEALCVSPVMDSIKPVLLELYINEVALTTTTFSIVPYFDGADVLKSDTNLLLREGDAVTLAWNPAHFFPTTPTNDFTVNIIVYYLSDAQNDSPSHWSNSTILSSNIANLGTATIIIPTKPLPLLTNLAPYTLLLLKVEFIPSSSSLNKYTSGLMDIDTSEPVGVWSNVMVYVAKNDSDYCNEWIDSNSDAFLSDDFSISSCPCNLAQAIIPNSGFAPITVSPGLIVLYKFLHPDSSTCFTSIETRPSNSNYYPAQICCYNSNNDLIVGVPNGGYQSLVSPLSPNKSWSFHFLSDISPYIGCCFPLSANCLQFYSKRPSDNCENFYPWRPGWLIGDPHMLTIDGHQYTFNGRGEFTMVNTLNNSFTIQGRMVPIVTDQGESKGTVLSSIAVKSTNSDIIELRCSTNNYDNNITVIVNGIHRDLSIDLKHYFSGFTVEMLSFNVITVLFIEDAISIKMTSEQNGVYFNSIGISLSEIYTNSTTGLLGNNNDDPSDDLLPRGSSWPLPLNSTLEDIHNVFGLSWMVSDPSKSLFTYDQSDSFSTYHHPEYIPLFEVSFTNSSLQTLAELQCQGSQLCLFDVAATGNIEVGVATMYEDNFIAFVVETSKPIECAVPCINGACVATNSCYCSYGYEGDQCNTPVYESCKNDSNPCQNGATCSTHLFSYFCTCVAGYTGEYCETTDCGDLLSNSPLLLVAYNNTISGSTAFFSCLKGYRIIGDIYSMCLENGSWSNTNTSECIIVDCSIPPSDNSHLIVSYNSTLFTAESTYSCNEGYSLRGTMVQVCQDNGQWSGDQPKCLINCGTPPTWGSGITVQYNDTVQGSVAVYDCENRNDELIGPDTITCFSNGTWSEEIIECREPSINEVLYIIIGSSIGGSVVIFLMIVMIVTIIGILLNRFRVTFEVQKRGIELTEI